MKSSFTKNLTLISIFILFSLSSSAFAQWEKHFIDANFTYPTVFQLGDIDSDGDLDVVILSYQLNDVVWYENNVEGPASWDIIDGNLGGALCVSIADIDGDDTLDVAVTGENADNVVWYKNNLNGTNWQKHTITTNLDGANWVNVADLDGDLDMDVIADGNLADKVIWCENNGDEPITWTIHTIDGNLDNARQMRIADIDGDTDLDVVAAGYSANDIVWYENNLPETTWNKHLVDGNLNGAVGLSLGDIDGDSKIDIVATGATSNEIVWYSNNHPTWTRYTIANLNFVRAVDLTDIDGDKDLDVVTTSSSDNDVVWFKNDYPNTNWIKNIIDDNLGGARAVYSADIDNDNDQDVFSVGQTANDVVWYKNPFSPQTIEGSFEFEGLTRNYEVHLPPNHQANMPAVFCLHSATSNLERIKNYSLIHELGNEKGFITVYPAAYGDYWNTGNVPTATANDVGFISALIDTLIVKYEIDISKVYSCGFGQGGAFSYKLAGELSNRITAIASVGAGMCEAMLPTSAPVREVPIFHLHGTEDTYEPWEGTDDPLYLLSVDETINHWVELNDCSPFYNTVSFPDIDPNDGCTVEKTSYNNSDGDTTIVLYKVNNGGHNWPGASENHNWEGNKTGDIDANTEIWNFFKDYANQHVNLAYGKEINCNTKFISPLNNDTLVLVATIHNPENHQVDVSAKIILEDLFIVDSTILYDDGLHNDELTLDNIFGSQFQISGFDENFYKIKLYTKDLDESTSIVCPNEAFFTTAGPIEFGSTEVDTLSDGRIALKNFVLVNRGIEMTVENIEAELTTLDTDIELSLSSKYFGDIPAGESKNIPAAFAFFAPEDNQLIKFEIKIKSNGKEYWTDSLIIDIANLTDIDNDLTGIPKEFSLKQNYPNPFNPSTSIKYTIPKQSNVTLKVFDVLGSEVVTLVNTEQPQGNYEVVFDASTSSATGKELTSGIYFYQLTAGQFVETKKLVILK